LVPDVLQQKHAVVEKQLAACQTRHDRLQRFVESLVGPLRLQWTAHKDWLNDHIIDPLHSLFYLLGTCEIGAGGAEDEDDAGYRTICHVFGADIAGAWQDIITRTDEVESLFSELEISLDGTIENALRKATTASALGASKTGL
jgi:hypothetical protein